MKKLLIATAIAGGLLASMGGASQAEARDRLMLSFDAGNVAFAYSDGYWDHDRRWHSWRSPYEARWYRDNYRHNYWNHRHSRAYNMGWRDMDRDGVPNRYDRDRDGDGIRNARDPMPNIPNYRGGYYDRGY